MNTGTVMAVKDIKEPKQEEVRLLPSDQGKLRRIKRLLESKYRLTPQRKSVLLALASTKPGEHPTAEEIYRIAKEHCPRLGRATVYRTLEMFSNLSIVQCLVLEDGCARYELKRDINHHHLICLSCGKILETDGNHPEPPLPGRADFKVTSSDVKFFGYCQKCYRKEYK